MKESYREGVANHPGPGPAEPVVRPESKRGPRAQAGRARELRKQRIPSADAVKLCGRPHGGDHHRKSASDSPPTIVRLCSNLSALLSPAPTPRRRACGACGSRLLPPACASPQASLRSPGSRAGSLLACTGSHDRAGLARRSRKRDTRYGLPLLRTGSAPGTQDFAAR